MFERKRPVVDPVSITFEGKAIEAERGEPLAVALLAAGEGVLARSPKLHRPRGPACLRGDCDGCIARVDGVPNIMLCSRAARGGETIGVQNVLGSRKTDLLRITDWFFPQGIDHHHLMAGIPGVGAAMQTFARQMAGVGRLPDQPRPPVAATRTSCDVMVVGGGLAGLACARRLVEAGVSVLLADEGSEPGGSARADAAANEHVAALVSAVAAKAEVLVEASAVGFYDGEVLVAGEARAVVVKPKALVLATGAHDGVLCVPGNDLPGVMSARAVCALAHRGVVPKDGAVIVGAGPWADRLARAEGVDIRRTFAADEVEHVSGRTRVRGVRTKKGEDVECGVVAVALEPAPAFQLATQAGAVTRITNGGFAVVVDETGRAAESLWAAGECTGEAFDPDALVAGGERAADGVLMALGAQPSMTVSKSPKPPAVKMKPKRPISAK